MVTTALVSVALCIQVQRKKWELLFVQTEANENLALTFSRQNCVCFCSWKIINAKAMECLEQGLVHMPIAGAFLKIEFYLLFSAVLALPCCTGFLWLWRAGATLCLWCVSFSLQRLLFCWVQASVVVLWAQQWCFLGSRSTGSSVVAHGLCWPEVCGLFLDQESNPRPLHWQADSQLLDQQRSPLFVFCSHFFIEFSQLFYHYALI